jgi:hypothetical protein
MPKSGRERKAKRGARQRVEAELTKTAGEHWSSDGSRELQNERENQALIKKALRWQTEVTKKSFAEIDPASITAKELAVQVTVRGMLSKDEAVTQSAVRNLIAMERQNQADQHKARPTLISMGIDWDSLYGRETEPDLIEQRLDDLEDLGEDDSQDLD